MKYIQLGDYGRDVEVWQQFLAQIWLIELDRVLPGSFDEPTHEATRSYQEECGLEPTGIVDGPTIERANTRGLQLINDRVAGGPSRGLVLAGISAFILTILVTQCMIVPDGGRSMQGVQLPVSPAVTPNAPQPRACPGWFC